MKKFLVLYCMPAAGLAEWMQKPEAERKEAEVKMQTEWRTWTAEHGALFADAGGGAGKMRKVTSAGTEDSKNDIMLYAIAQGDSREAVAEEFTHHPHLAIPGAWIEVMEMNKMG